MNMETKSVQMFTKEIEGRKVTGIAAVMGNIDSDHDIVHRGAFKKTIAENMRRVKHLWAHISRKPPIATINELKEVPRGQLPEEVREKFPEVKGGLQVTRTYLDTPRADEVFAGLVSEPPAITEMSFAFRAIKWDMDEIEVEKGQTMRIRNLRELALYDTSDVLWGANAATSAIKSTIPYTDQGTADEAVEWSVLIDLFSFTDQDFEDLAPSEKSRIMAHFTFSKNAPPENFDDLKLPHHQVIANDIGPAVWDGVRAAMSALLAGEVDVSPDDQKSIYEHLSKHYQEWEKQAPPLKFINLVTTVRDLLPLIEQGSIEPVEDLETSWLFEAFAELQKLLTAEPPGVDLDARTLTESALMRRLAIAQRDPIMAILTN